MTMFGVDIKIEASKFKSDNSLIDGFVGEVVKRSNERGVFVELLESDLANGRSVIEEITKRSNEKAIRQLKSGTEIKNPLLVDFVLNKLKVQQNGSLNLYEEMIRKIIERENPKFIEVHQQIEKGKYNDEVPFGYPDASKKANSILIGKIKDGIDSKLKLEFLEQQNTKVGIRNLAKEMFYAINKFDLKNEELISYLKLHFELRFIQAAPMENQDVFKKQLAEAVKKNERIHLVFIKSLRYSYVDGKRMVVIGHLGDVEKKDINGDTRVYFNEYIILKRLEKILELISDSNVEVDLTVLIADNDLEILFPEDNSFVPKEDVVEARKSAERYIKTLKKEASGLTANVHLLTEYLQMKKLDDKYSQKVKRVYKDAKGPNIIVRDSDVEERVNYRYEFFSSLYGKSYSRKDARDTMCNQVAHVMALSVVFEDFEGVPVVLMDDRGRENKMVGGLNSKSRSIFLTKLKEPTIIKKA